MWSYHSHAFSWYGAWLDTGPTLTFVFSDPQRACAIRQFTVHLLYNPIHALRKWKCPNLHGVVWPVQHSKVTKQTSISSRPHSLLFLAGFVVLSQWTGLTTHAYNRGLDTRNSCFVFRQPLGSNLGPETDWLSWRGFPCLSSVTPNKKWNLFWKQVTPEKFHVTHAVLSFGAMYATWLQVKHTRNQGRLSNM
jgi:hypothetical protein